MHIASGLVLLLAFRRAKTAKPVAIGFGVVYGIVTIIGLIDGNDVVGLIPINAADNVLHLGLSALGILAGLIPAGTTATTSGRASARRAPPESSSATRASTASSGPVRSPAAASRRGARSTARSTATSTARCATTPAASPTART